jgi:hypothetical protein
LLWRVLGPAASTEPAFVRNDVLDDAVALVGYDLSPRTPRPGDAMQVSLIWEALRPLDTVYHSYIHLIDADGNRVAQSDRQPGGVHYPTTLWQPGERLRDDHSLEIPADAVPGIYRMVAGMYALTEDGSLQPLGEPVTLGQIEVSLGASLEMAAAGQPLLPPNRLGNPPLSTIGDP